jgi:tetratricopeptide (TPR) repeat protein
MSVDPGDGGAPPDAATEALFSRACSRHQAGDLPAAEWLYQQVLAARSTHADSLHLLGLVRAQTGRPEAAVEPMTLAIALRPDFDLALYNLGNVLRRLERHEEAADAYRRALRIRPGYPAALVNLGATLRTLGRSEEAVDLYRRALAMSPGSAVLHYNLGVALQQLGRDDQAAQAYRQAIALQPGDADAWANLAAVLLALGRPGLAIDACRRRIALEPNSADAHSAHAVALLWADRADEAVEAARRAAELEPDQADAHLYLGNSLLEQGKVTAAAGAYLRAASLRPDDVNAWVNLAIGLQEAGRGGEAATVIAQALKVDPHSAAAWTVHGGLKTFRAGDPDVEALQRLLTTAEDDAAEDRVALEFALGKAFMDIGDADQAFAHLDRGNRLHRDRLRYDVNEDVRQFAEIARSLNADRIAQKTGDGDPSGRPVFIVGMPRSGTTLVEQILASHPEVFGAGERTTLERLVIERLGPGLPPTERARRLADLTGADLKAMGSAYAGSMTALAPGAQRVTDKMPSNFRFAGLIGLMLPNARIIHCRRDPVDTCLSCYARKFSRGQEFAYDLRELGTYYRAYDGLMAHWRAILPEDRFLDVSYEQVVDDLELQARRLIAFCSLDWDDACLAFHRTERLVRTASVNQVRQPLYRTSVARWKAYERHLGPLMEALNDRPGAP